MKRVLQVFLMLLLSANLAISQTDTTYLYFGKGWQTTSKDSAYYYGKVYRQGEAWGRKDYWVKGNTLQMEATYIDKETKIGHGTFKWYREDGKLKYIALYEQGKKKTADYFYESGKKKGHVDYNADGTDKQQGWSESGQEIPNYIVEREALFPGGLTGWRIYLEENLNAAVASKSKPGNYVVKVQFIVSKDGSIGNVEAIEVPEGCRRCGKEAVRIIKNGPDWIPAIQDNLPAVYQAIQGITFQAVEE